MYIIICLKAAASVAGHLFRIDGQAAEYQYDYFWLRSPALPFELTSLVGVGRRTFQDGLPGRKSLPHHSLRQALIEPFGPQ